MEGYLEYPDDRPIILSPSEELVLYFVVDMLDFGCYCEQLILLVLKIPVLASYSLNSKTTTY